MLGAGSYSSKLRSNIGSSLLIHIEGNRCQIKEQAKEQTIPGSKNYYEAKSRERGLTQMVHVLPTKVMESRYNKVIFE